jgi:hypothetical protein
LRRRFCGVVGRGFQVVEILVDRIADGLAPFFFADGGNEFMLREMEGLKERLSEIGESGGRFGLDIAAGYGGKEACEGGAEIASGDEVTGEEIGKLVAKFFGGAGFRFLAGVVEAELRMSAGAGSTATAAICKSEKTSGYAILRK